MALPFAAACALEVCKPEPRRTACSTDRPAAALPAWQPFVPAAAHAHLLLSWPAWREWCAPTVQQLLKGAPCTPAPTARAEAGRSRAAGYHARGLARFERPAAAPAWPRVASWRGCKALGSGVHTATTECAAGTIIIGCSCDTCACDAPYTAVASDPDPVSGPQGACTCTVSCCGAGRVRRRALHMLSCARPSADVGLPCDRAG